MSRIVVVMVFAWLVLWPDGARAGSRYDLDAGRELALGGVAAAGGAFIWWGSSRTEPLTAAELAALDPGRLPAWDRVATRLWSPRAARWSDVLGYGLTVAPLLLLVESGDEVSAGELLAMYAETVALDRALVGSLKLGVGRVRPLAYNPDPRIPWSRKTSGFARRSFPSGHTSGAFAGAVFAGQVYARLHPDRAARHWVRGGALGLAAVTGYLRVRAGHHFPSDAVVGALMGGLVGWAVPELHERDVDPVVPDLPGRGVGGPTLAFCWGF